MREVAWFTAIGALTFIREQTESASYSETGRQCHRVFGVRNLRGMAKGEQDARRGSVFDL